MTQITCAVHGHSTVEPKFLDCPWCLESTITTQSAALRLAVEELATTGTREHSRDCYVYQFRNHNPELYVCHCKRQAALTACREALGGDG